MSIDYPKMCSRTQFVATCTSRFLRVLRSCVAVACLIVINASGALTAERVRFSVAIGIPQDLSNLSEVQYFDRALLSMEGKSGKQFYLVFSYSQLSTGNQSSPALLASVVSSVFAIEGNDFAPIRDELIASTVLKHGSYVDPVFGSSVGKDGTLSSVMFPAIRRQDCNMLSHRMYFSRKQYDKRDEWYLLRVSNRSQFADQEVGRSCSNLEGEGRAWTKAATLTPAIYLVDGRYLIVDRSFPFAMFFDQIHPVCVVQKTEDGQVILHLLSNYPLPKILSGDLESENHMRLFQNKIMDGFDDLITGLESEYKCIEMENARGQTTTLIPDNGRPYAQIFEKICPHGPPVSGECKSK